MRNPLNVTLHYDHAAVGQAARDSYAGFVDVTPGAAPGGGAVLECVVDHARLELLMRAPGRYAALRSAGAGPRFAQGMSIRLPDRSVLVLGSTDSGSLAILDRELRILFARQFLGAGWLPFHAAGATEPDGGAVLLMGPKMAGKTTTLLRMLRAGASGVIANDKVFVKAASEGTPVEVRSLPVSIGIRADTLELFPQLAALRARAGRLHVDNGDADGGRVILPLRSVADAFGTQIRPAAPVAAIAAVRFTPDNPRLRPLEVNDLEVLLPEQRLDHCTKWRENWLAPRPGERLLARDASAVIAGLRAVPGFSMEIAADNDAVIGRLFAEMRAPRLTAEADPRRPHQDGSETTHSTLRQREYER